MPHVAMAREPMQAGSAIVPRAPVMVASQVTSDVALHDGGVLLGHVFDEQGAPLAGTQVSILQQRQLLSSTTTDRHGRFTVNGLRGGTYQIETAQSSHVYRLWAPHSAPPGAQADALVVSRGGLVRSQNQPDYGPAIRGGIAGALLGAGLFWALDYNAGS